VREADYVVIRLGDDIPAEWNIGDLDGKWFDRTAIPVGPSREARKAANARWREQGGSISGVTASPTGRFEVREDGAVAEVFELLPLYD
jgi:hypothetical protein